MYKASVVRLISSGHGISKSSDRLRRVQGLSKTPGKKSSEESITGDQNTITIRDPVVTMSCKQRCTYLVVMFVDKITDDQKRSVSIINCDAPAAIVSGRPLQLENNGSWLETEIGISNKQMELKATSD